MARTKKTEKAEPKQAEIISLASLRARREAKRADISATTYVLTGGDAGAKDIVLCALKDGGYTLAFVESRGERGTYMLYSNRPAGEITGVYGRVVMVEVTDVRD
jgi:hypothetical protein